MVAKAMSAKAALRDAIVAMLPEDGTPVLNRVMRVMLARKLVGTGPGKQGLQRWQVEGVSAWNRRREEGKVPRLHST